MIKFSSSHELKYNSKFIGIVANMQQIQWLILYQDK